MKISFEFDTERDDITRKVDELKKIERLIFYRTTRTPAFMEGEDWLLSRPDKAF